jgi:starch synthase
MGLRILFITAEAAPFAKTGGLGDVAGALPKALASLGHEVRVVMPAYASIERALQEGRWGLRAAGPTLRVPILGGLPAGMMETVLPGSAVPVHFIAERHLFERADLYGYADDPYRFAFFSRAALQLAIEIRDWRPDVVHAHDWHAAPAILWLATGGALDPRYRALPTVFTIHNLLHQGRTSTDILRYLAISGPQPWEEGPGEVNLMARAIYHATMINTVSPTYAAEIMTRDGGMGLDGLLRYRHFDVHGIVNGLDTDVWDPARDRSLAATYDADSLERRGDNKRALQSRLGLPVRPDVPLVAMVSRLDVQKGVDLAAAAAARLPGASADAAQFAVLGSGAAEYEGEFRRLAAAHPDRMAAVLTYDPSLAPLMYAGSDIFVMPSRFEPCGLGQLIAMRYGSVPVVRATGGLADTVEDGETGFTFGPYDVDAFWSALQRAIAAYRQAPDGWREMQRRGMARDFSWAPSARGYQQLYEWAIARVRGW